MPGYEYPHQPASRSLSPWFPVRTVRSLPAKSTKESWETMMCLRSWERRRFWGREGETIEEERRGVVSIVKGHFVVVKDSVFSFYEKDTNFHFWVIFDGDRELTEWRYLMKYLQKECTDFEKGDIFWKRYERKRNNNNNLKNFAVFVVKRSLNNANVEHGMWSTRVGIEVGMGNFTFLLTWETGWEMWRCWFNDHI